MARRLPSLRVFYRAYIVHKNNDKLIKYSTGAANVNALILMLDENGIDYNDVVNKLKTSRNCSSNDIYFERLGRDDVIQVIFYNGKTKLYHISMKER